MGKTKIIISYLAKKPLVTGFLTVLLVTLLGFGIGITTGVISVPNAEACCVLPPQLISPLPPPLPIPLPVIVLPVYAAPTCTLSASVSSFSYGGGNSTLSWTTAHVKYASINNGIGSVSTTGGSKQIHVSTTGTYVLSVSGSGGKATCDAKITVAPPPTPTCTLSSSPSSIQKGNSSKLTYTTTHATSFTINHSVGALTPVIGGSTHVSPTQTTTYTGTASGAGGKTVTCSAKVTMTTPPPPAPSPLTITATKIVCQKESDLPNWSGTSHVMTKTTAIDYVAAHPDCHLASGWTFEWANGGTPNPGNEKTNGGSGWTPFGPTTSAGTATATINKIIGGRVWVREEFRPGYIPFTGDAANASSVSAELYCHTDVLNYDNYDAVTNPHAGKAYYCVAWNVLKKMAPPPTPKPTCTLSSSPSSIQKGSSSKLTYTTTHATSFTINHSVGALTPVVGGSTHVSPTQTTTYTGTAKGAGGAVTCSAKVTVTTPPPPNHTAPTCTLSANPTVIAAGGVSSLSWTTTHASSFTINNGIGVVASTTLGTTTVTPANTITYTGTAKNSDETTSVCHATVTVTHGGGGGGPMCVLIIASKTIPSGATTTLSWGGSGIKKVFIDNGIGTTTNTNGSVPISPSVGTHTYTGTFTAFSGQKLKCSSKLTVTGGGPTAPSVMLAYFRKSPPSHPLAMVYLSQFPSTGLYLGTVGTIIYWLILVAWSVALAYVLLFIIAPFLKRKMRTFGAQVRTVLNTSPASQNIPPTPSHIETFVQPLGAVEDRSAHSSYEGFKSFAQSGTLSVDDIVHGLSRTEQKHDVSGDIATAPAQQSVASAQSFAQPVTNGVDTASTLSGILSTQTKTMTHSKDMQNQTTAESLPSVAPRIEEQQLVHTNGIDSSSVASTRGFVTALLEGDRTAVFYALRQVARGGGDTTRFLADATCMLDDAFRSRVDGAECDPDVVRLAAKYQTPVLEEIITALATAIDASYSSNTIAAKLALTRALSRIGA